MENKLHYKDSISYPRDPYNPKTQILNPKFNSKFNPNYIYPENIKKTEYDRYFTESSTYGNFFDKGEDKNPKSRYMENFLKSTNHSNQIYSFVEKQIKEDDDEKSGKKNNVLLNNPATFWMGNLNNSNMYRSFTKGPNPFARSNAFTQPIQKTRGAVQYYQNAYNDI